MCYVGIGLFSRTKFLDVGRTVFEKGVTVVVLEIELQDKLRWKLNVT